MNNRKLVRNWFELDKESTENRPEKNPKPLGNISKYVKNLNENNNQCKLYIDIK